MARREKTRAEIAAAFYVNRAEIDRLLECGRVTAEKIFNSARLTDMHELGANYFEFRPESGRNLRAGDESEGTGMNTQKKPDGQIRQAKGDNDDSIEISLW